MRTVPSPARVTFTCTCTCTLLELTDEQAEDFERALARVREERGEAVPPAEALQEISRRSLGAPVERPGYQLVIQQCATCRAASRDTREGPLRSTKRRSPRPARTPSSST